MSLQSARHLLRGYCRPVNYLNLMKDLAKERGIHESAIQELIDSGEFTIETGRNYDLICRNPDFKPTLSKKTGIDKHDLLNVLNTADVFSTELDQPVRDAKWQSLKCPFHEDSHPSLRILLPDGGYECKGCGERGGSVIDFTMKLHHLSFPDSINYLANRYTSIRQMEQI
jgi:hypothetical protein